MKLVLVLVALALITTLNALFWFRPRPSRARQVSLSDIPRLLAALLAATRTPAFAVLMFPAVPGKDDGDYVNLQFSMEDGRLGFDWVLLALPNIENRDRFMELARAGGYVLEEKEAKRVKYLRVENGDLAHLCQEVITKMYSRPENDPIDLIVEGLDWEP